MTILFLTNNWQITHPLYDWLNSIETDNIIQWNRPINSESIISTFNVSTIRFLISYNYSHIIRRDIIDMFPNRIINLHISFLPYNRGASPNFWSFFNNTPKGVTIHLIDEGLDTGDILVQEELHFDNEIETFATTYNKLQYAIQKIFKENWDNIKNQKIVPKRQTNAGSFHKKNDLDTLTNCHPIAWDETIASVLKKLR